MVNSGRETFLDKDGTVCDMYSTCLKRFSIPFQFYCVIMQLTKIEWTGKDLEWNGMLACTARQVLLSGLIVFVGSLTVLSLPSLLCCF